ncbi:MAG: PKD domain-containing protein, partial [Bacteroidia bacterium]|nr:PKD domain-containing protein [Bacteroidia bacterium]
ATQCLNGNRFDFFNRTKLNGFGWVPKYYWDFGDGTHDYINTFTYGKTYTQAGTYTVSLVAESNYGCKDTNTILVHVLPNGQCTPGLIRPALDAKNNTEGAIDQLNNKTGATALQNTRNSQT